MTPHTTWSGLVAVDKPSGPTSHDVVARVRDRLASPGAGHLGTLDPSATGLLLIALGAATRAIRVWQGGTKTYEATLRFGVVTDSQDLDGRVLETHDATGLDESRVRAATAALVGERTQVPPMVSALKIGGERLHALARRGVMLERAPRRVTVHAWEWLGFAWPEARFRVTCSGGTYVRTLAHDLGRSLGVGAAIGSLRRIRSEPFGLERAVPLAMLEEWSADQVLARAGIPLDQALEVLPAVVLDETGATTLGMGGRPPIDGAPPTTPDPPLAVVFRDRGGRALALGERRPDPARPGRALAAAHVVFPWAVRTGAGRAVARPGGGDA
ncbi:MAG: tRNA pseudouridine(55) synthase TruB [Candidatus Eisenbacteria bacterium]